MTTRLRLLIAGAVASGVFVAGCAQADSEKNVATPSDSPSPSASVPGVPPLSVSASASPVKTTSGSEITLTGLVERVDIEGGCMVLRTDASKTYELKGGDPTIVRAGNRVTVTGRVRSDLVTICQMGPVFEVISSRPA